MRLRKKRETTTVLPLQTADCYVFWYSGLENISLQRNRPSCRTTGKHNRPNDVRMFHCITQHAYTYARDQSSTSVSYTHLDVYKRQVCVCVCHLEQDDTPVTWQKKSVCVKSQVLPTEWHSLILRNVTVVCVLSTCEELANSFFSYVITDSCDFEVLTTRMGKRL